jgi:hypothetical protein
LDLGGKAPLRANTLFALAHHRMVTIFLYANPKVVKAHLQHNDEWRLRSAYLNQSLADPVNGWQNHADRNYRQRLPKHIENSHLIIDICEPSGQEKTTDQLVKEILYRVKELELVCAGRSNVFTQQFAR